MAAGWWRPPDDGRCESPYCLDDMASDDGDAWRCGSSLSRDENAANAVLLSQSLTSNSMSELSSLYSMSEDDFDRHASRRIQLMLDTVNAMLYEPSGICEHPHLTSECDDWTATFPHLRVIGRQLVSPVDQGFQIYPRSQNPAMAPTNYGRQFAGARELAVSGKQVTAVSFSSQYDALPHIDDLESGLPLIEEEIIEQCGSLEEILAIDRLSVSGEEDNAERRRAASRLQRGLPPVTPVHCLRDSILSVVFDNIMAKIMPHLTNVIDKMLDIKQTAVDFVGATDSWKTRALMLMEPPGDLTQRNYPFSLSPSDALSVQDDKTASRSSSLSSSAPLSSGLPLEMATLNGVLTVRSKALLAREKTFMTHDATMDENSFHVPSTSPQSRPSSGMAETVFSLPVSHGSIAGSARRRTSITGRPLRLSPLDKFKMSIIEEDRRRNLEVLRGTKLPMDNRPGNTALALSGVGQSSQATSSPSDLGAFSGHSSNSQPASSVTRSLLPPISHKRDAASANINRMLPSHRSVPLSVVPHVGRESKLLPGREKSLMLDTRPSTTHTVSRVETSQSMGRRTTLITSRPSQGSTDGMFKGAGRRRLNLARNNIVPLSSHTSDLMVNARHHDMELDESSYVVGSNNLPGGRGRMPMPQHPSPTLVR